MSFTKPSDLNITNSDLIWMERNLDVEKFKNGDIIPQAHTNKEWENACNNKQPAWCYYNDSDSLGKKYGKIYNWFAVNDKRGLAPEGWHIATIDEWKNHPSLENEIQIAGFRNCFGAFWYINTSAYWWCAEDNDGSNSAWAFKWDTKTQKKEFLSNLKGCGSYVRCVKNK